MPQISILIVALTLLFGSCDTAFSQSDDSQTQNLINALGKTKYKKKEKKNVSIEIYVDIKSEAVVKNNVQDYAGVYQSESGDYQIELRVAGNGAVEGNGREPDLNNSQKRSFTFKNAEIKGALLTATKVFTGGEIETLEAVFNNRTTVVGKNPNELSSRQTQYGLGYIDSLEIGDKVSTNRVFLEFNP